MWKGEKIELYIGSFLDYSLVIVNIVVVLLLLLGDSFCTLQWSDSIQQHSTALNSRHRDAKIKSSSCLSFTFRTCTNMSQWRQVIIESNILCVSTIFCFRRVISFSCSCCWRQLPRLSCLQSQRLDLIRSWQTLVSPTHS